MRLSRPAALAALVLVLAAALQARVARGVPPPLSAPALTAPDREDLIGASGDPRLAPWQRELMLEWGTNGTPSVTGADPADGTWTLLGGSPRARYYHSAVYDNLRNRMIIFGGLVQSGGTEYLNDTWELSLGQTPTWTQLSPAGQPPSPRYGQAAVYDPIRDRMIVYGGWDGAFESDVWTLSFAGTPTWSQLVSAPAPRARYLHTAVYDAARDRMVVFGGATEGRYRKDTWALSLSGTPTWAPIVTPTTPLARGDHAAVYDPVHDVMFVFGGFTAGGARNDTWVLRFGQSGNTWSPVPVGGSVPSPRASMAIVYDSMRGEMVLFGGTNSSFEDFNDAWALSISRPPMWRPLSPSGTPPAKRFADRAVYAPDKDAMVLFGGASAGPIYYNETWSLALAGAGTWSEITPGGAPPARAQMATVYDSIRKRMVVFGGVGATNMNDVWAFSFADAGWAQLFPAGSPPSPRRDCAAVYDSLRDRVVLFGGYDGTSRSDVWSLGLAGIPSWSQLFPGGSGPSARWGAGATYDPVRDRMVVFGGGNTVYLSDTWALDFAGTPSWTLLAGSGAGPSARAYCASAYDPVRDRMVSIGGNNYAVVYNDVWTYSFSGAVGWSQGQPSGTPPSPRYGHTLVYDGRRDRMVLVGGAQTQCSGDACFFGDTWALSLGSPAWTQLHPDGIPVPRYVHACAYDPASDELAVYGGANSTGALDDTWILSFGGGIAQTSTMSVGQEASPTSSLSVDAVQSDPTANRLSATIRLPAEQQGHLELWDVQGRRVLASNVAASAESTHHVVVSTSGIAAGMYVLRVSAAGHAVTTKTFVLH